MKTPLLLALGLTALTACNNSTQTAASKSTASKGKSEFQMRMAQGAGVFRPEAIRTEEKYSLAGNAVASVKLDEHSGAWTWAGFDTTQGEVIRADIDLLAYAKTFITEHETELGFSPGEILLEDGGIQTPYPKTRLITLRRQIQGTEIKGAFVNLFFAVQSDGSLRLSEVVNNSYGPVKISGKPELLSDADASEVTGVSDLKVESKRSIIAPSLKDGHYEFAYATEFALKDTVNGEKISLTVNNASKTIQEAYSNRVYEMNTIQAETYKTSYVLKDLVTRPLEFLQILDGGKETTTDGLGLADLSSSKVTVTLHNTKNNSSVYTEANQRQPISFDVTLGPDGQTVIKFGEGQSTGINVYASVTETINFAAKYLTEEELKLIRNGFDTVVDINQSCNAYYDGQLNFFKQSKDCANTGLISDVVKHEWGHGLDDFLGIKSRHNSNNQSGITDSAYSEGIGDILASYVSRSPNMGPGFFLNDPKALRVLVNDRKYPPANQNEAEAHSLGLVVGGAFWDMHANISNIYGVEKGNDVAARLFFRHLITSDRYLDAYQAVLRVDDDDNNTMTPSPHYCSITRAFSRHNISGGETVGSDCVDTDTSVTVKIDADQGEGKLNLVLSAAGAAKLIGCAGKVTACKSGDTGFVEFESKDGDDIELAKNGRKYYQGGGIVDVKANGTYTFFSIDAKNAVLAKRTLEFKADSSGESPIK